MSVFISSKIYKTVIYPVLLYRFETFSLLMWLIVYENLVLRKVFGPKREEVTEDLRELRNEYLHDLYCSVIVFQVN